MSGSSGGQLEQTPVWHHKIATQNTNLQIEPNTKSLSWSIPDVDIPEEARKKQQEFLNKKFVHIVSQTATDIGRTDLIELDIPMEGLPIT